VTNPADVVSIIAKKRRANCTSITVQFARPRWTATTGEGVPNLQFDQLNVIAHHLHTIRTGETLWDDPLSWPEITPAAIALAVMKGLALPKLTQRKAPHLEDWPKFEKSEWSQLDKYAAQGMFGKPCPQPAKNLNAIILPWVWTYLYKIDPITLEDTEKSRGTCNRGARHGKVVTLAETHAACMEQPVHRLSIGHYCSTQLHWPRVRCLQCIC
jgi:hypothetical protein